MAGAFRWRREQRDTRKVSDIHTTLIAWFKKNARDLPWRTSDTTPWQVLVSEIMLQQTPASRVAPQYEAWIHRWPDAQSLSAASPADVIRQWDKLGYPNRALRLQETARIVNSQYGGQLPQDYAELIALPGIGDYTANAILGFAYQKRSTVLDTNIRRVIARVWHGQERPSPVVSKTERQFAEQLVPTSPRKAAKWNIAIMEFGALLCTAQKPQCTNCPLSNQCAWKQAGFPSSDYKRRTQKYVGTDRQVRGLILGILRSTPASVDRKQLFINAANPKQYSRALESLLKDGLVEQTRTGKYRLPR